MVKNKWGVIEKLKTGQDRQGKGRECAKGKVGPAVDRGKGGKSQGQDDNLDLETLTPEQR